jgi:hypothetical protein
VISARVPAFDLRRSLAWGTAWAMTVTIVEALAIHPIDAWGSIQQLLFWVMYWMAPLWCLVGAVFVWLASRSNRTTNLRTLIPIFIVLSALLSAVQPPIAWAFTSLIQGIVPSLERYMRESGLTPPLRENWLSIGLYLLWVNLFYGALLMTVCRLTLRDERMRHRLHQSAMARSRTQALLDAERLQALQAQIDPNLLLGSMQELKERYRGNPEGAERLLEALVEFMRCAMHGLRTSVSTVNAEVQLARAFAQLQRERGFEGAWRVIEEPASDPPLSHPFPSLLMLPLLALASEGGRPVLKVRSNQESSVLSLHGLAQGISGDLMLQVRSRLLALYGDRFDIETGSLTHSQLAITLHSNPLNPGHTHDESNGR